MEMSFCPSSQRKGRLQYHGGGDIASKGFETGSVTRNESGTEVSKTGRHNAS